MLRLVLCHALLFTLPSSLAAQSDTGADAYAFAAGLHDRGLHERAATAFRKFLEKWPAHPRTGKARFYLGQSLCQIDKDEEALEEFESALEAGVKGLEMQARLRAGELSQRLGRHEQAVKHLARFEKAKVDKAILEPALYFLGEAWIALGQKDDGKRAHGRLVRDHPKSTYASYAHSALGFLAFEDKQYQKARIHFERVVEAAGKDALNTQEAATMVGECWLRLSDNQRALESFRAVLEKGGASAQEAQARLGVAQALLGLSRPDEAILAFVEFADRHPDDQRTPRALIKAAIALHEKGDHERGLEVIGRVTNASGKDSEDLAFWSGRMLEASGNLDEGIKRLRAAAGSSPGRKFNLGDVLSRAGRFEEAATVFATLRKETDDPSLLLEASFAEAFARNRLKQYQAAIAILRGMEGQETPPDLTRDRTFAMGENLFALEKYKEARPWYAGVVKSGEGRYFTDALYKQGWCAWNLKDYDGAIKAFRQMVQADPESPLVPEARYLVAKCLESSGKKSEAARLFKDLAAASGNPQLKVRSLLGTAAMARANKDPDEAIKAYRGALDANPTGPFAADALLGLGDVLLQTMQNADAEQAYRIMIEGFPEHSGIPAARLGRGWALRALKRHDESAAEAKQAAQVTKERGERGEALYLLGLVHQDQKKHEQAAQFFGTLVREQPDHARGHEARLALGVSLARLGRFEEAAVELKEAAGERTRNGADTALYELAFCYEEAKALQQRDLAFQQLIAEHPESTLVPDALFRLGEGAYARKQWQAALEHYRALHAHALGKDLRDKAAYKGAWCLRQVKQHPEAAAAFGHVAGLRASPYAAESCYLAGDESEAAGTHEQAATWFKRMISEHPRHELALDARFRHVILLRRLQRYGEVIRRAPDVLTSNASHPRAAQAWTALADAFYEKHQWERSRAAYKQVTSLSEGPLGARAQYRIGRAFQKAGELSKATDELLKVVILYGHAEWSARAALQAGVLLGKQGHAEKARRILKDLIKDFPDTKEAEEAARLVKSEEGSSK